MHLFSAVVVLCVMAAATCLPNSGIIDFQLNEKSNMKIVLRALVEKSQIFVLVSCVSNSNATIAINWYILKSKCYGVDEAGLDNAIFSHTDASSFFNNKFNRTKIVRESSQTNQCVNPILLESHSDDYRELDKSNDKLKHFPSAISSHPIYVADDSGAFYFFMQVKSADTFNLTVRYKAVSSGRYLSAIDWPLLPFYKVMWIVYTVLAIVWLLVSFIQFKDLLRIQFWIGAVILLGMLEKSVFYMEYSSVNETGVSVKGMLLFAELVSCAKRSLSRMLVIIVSLGFGIVKPRLGATLVLVALIGTLYFLLASFESYLRIYKAKTEKLLVSAIPLALLDSIVCWWIFSSLLQTIQVLKLRRNIVKLNLYRNFSFTLLFAVVLSIAFMLYSIREHKLVQCVTDWENLWLDEAFWHILFSMLLIVIMLLFRPTRNNQRYAFTQLLDNPEDEFYDGDEYGDDNDRDVDQFVNDAFDIKIRILNSGGTPRTTAASASVAPEVLIQDELNRINENKELTSIIDRAIPIFDSDDETNSKFEVSKMQ